MKSLNLKPNAELPENVLIGDVMLDWLHKAVQLGNPSGLTPREHRQYDKVMTAVENAVEDGCDEIELEDADFEFLRECFRRARIPASNNKLALVFYDLFQIET